ncbi:GlxA family transcriptional regulator [Rathayibacter festucae]|uniref:GlxA family transcriptional regulator n=1 Tax=Rathayibacter festucae TaxID=110937 RepID=UPI002A6A77B1|nr:GlxA family transcriptional regulator [Rathayibacter festucae]MDY0914492.1 GlxA family transcriptional regulator [Rathayibacter festucae]
MSPSRTPHVVGIVVFDDFKSLDATGPMEVLAEANAEGAHYKLLVLSPGGRSVRASNGLQVQVDAAVDGDLPHLDTLIVTGGDLLPTTPAAAGLVDALRDLAPRSDRVAGICTGAFLLGAAGLLDGRRTTTHWKHISTLAAAFPATAVEPDALFVHDGAVHTSAGVTAGIDLTLALVELDHGGDLARRVAQALVVFLQRPGGQSQFSPSLLLPRPSTPSLRALTDSIAADPSADHSSDALARRAAMSARHLTRLFTAEIGTTPRAYVDSVRLHAACTALEQGATVTEAVTRAGFAGADALRRAFRAQLGVTPHEYRCRFASTGTDVRAVSR